MAKLWVKRYICSFFLDKMLPRDQSTILIHQRAECWCHLWSGTAGQVWAAVALVTVLLKFGQPSLILRLSTRLKSTVGREMWSWLSDCRSQFQQAVYTRSQRIVPVNTRIDFLFHRVHAGQNSDCRVVLVVTCGNQTWGEASKHGCRKVDLSCWATADADCLSWLFETGRVISPNRMVFERRQRESEKEWETETDKEIEREGMLFHYLQ